MQVNEIPKNTNPDALFEKYKNSGNDFDLIFNNVKFVVISVQLSKCGTSIITKLEKV